MCVCLNAENRLSISFHILTSLMLVSLLLLPLFNSITVCDDDKDECYYYYYSFYRVIIHFEVLLLLFMPLLFYMFLRQFAIEMLNGYVLVHICLYVCGRVRNV